MAKVSAKVLDAVVDGKGKGETVEIDERSAKHLEGVGYVQILPKEEKQSTKKPSEKGTSAPKKGGSQGSQSKSKQKQTDSDE